MFIEGLPAYRFGSELEPTNHDRLDIACHETAFGLACKGTPLPLLRPFRHTSVIDSHGKKPGDIRELSSLGIDIFSLRSEGASVTHVFGTFPHLCLRTGTPRLT